MEDVVCPLYYPFIIPSPRRRIISGISSFKPSSLLSSIIAALRGRDKWEIVVVPAFDVGGFRSSAADLFVVLIWEKVKRKETLIYWTICNLTNI